MRLVRCWLRAVALPLFLLAAPLLAASPQTLHVERTTPPRDLKPLPMFIGGRTLAEDDAANAAFGAKQYVYQWPGTYFAVAFRGPEVFFRIGGGREILHVVADGQPPVVLTTPEPGVYRVSGLGGGDHTLRLEVVTESQSAPDSFDGFAIPASATPLPPPVRPHQIEFIGDSYTVGYGNTSPTRECSRDQVWSTTDTSQAFGPLVAAQEDAEDQINAISGHGVVRNYDGSPGDPVPVAYPYVLFDRKNVYRDTSWHPQLIVIGLGTNDFSTPLHPGEPWKTRAALHADYEATYVRFLHLLRARNPQAYLLLWATDGANGEIQTEVQKVVAQYKASGDSRIAFLPVNGLGMTACDWHLSTADDRTVAGMIDDFLHRHPEILAAEPR